MNIYRFPHECGVETLAETFDPKGSMNDGPMSDAVRDQKFTYGRWERTFGMNTQDRVNSAAYIAYLKKMMVASAQFGRCFMPDVARLYPRGGWAALAPELVANPFFYQGVTGWTYANAGAASRVTGERKLRLATDAVHAGMASAPLVVAANTQYLLRAFSEFLNLPSATYGIGTTAALQDIAATAAVSTDGYAELLFNSGANVALFANVKGAIGAAANQYMQSTMISVQRVFRVDGAGQVGNLLKIKDLPVSTNDLMLPTDLLQLKRPGALLGVDLYEVADSVDSDAAGKATLYLSSPLRQAYADNTPIATNYAMFMAKYRSKLSYKTDPGIFRSFVNDVVEDTIS